MDHFLHTHSSCNMQVTVDHSIAGSQAISGRTPLLLSYTRHVQSILGTDPTSFSGHSSRRGATNTTATAGIPTASLLGGRYRIHFPLSQQPHSQPGPPNFGIIPLRRLPTIESPTGFSGPKLRVWVPSASVPGCECQQHRLV